MSSDVNQPARSITQTIFAMIAITMGAMALVQGLMRGHSAGFEEMAIYTGPAVVAGLIAIAVRRNKLGYWALTFAGLAVVGFFLGA